jgi:hypothetical protein
MEPDCRAGKTGAPKLSAALIFFGYFFVSRQKSNWGLGQRPILLINNSYKRITSESLQIFFYI